MPPKPEPLKLPSPDCFWDLDNQPALPFRTWIKNFGMFLDLTNLGRVTPLSEKEKNQFLCLHLGREGLRIFQTNPAYENLDELSHDEFKEAVKLQFDTPKNPVQSHHALFMMRQTSTEKIAEFLARLRRQMADCDYCENCSKLTLAVMVAAGCNDKEAQQQLLRLKQIDLDTFITTLQAHESATTASHTMVLNSNAKIEAIRHQPKNAAFRPSTRNDLNSNCFACGYNLHSSNIVCPAKNATCNHCGKVGHFFKVCRSRLRGIKVRNLTDEQNSLSEDATNINTTNIVDMNMIKTYVNTTTSFISEVPPFICPVEIKVDSSVLKRNIEVDSGAAISTISQSIFHRNFKKDSMLPVPNGFSVHNYDGHPVKVMGYINAEVKHGTRSANLKMFVMPDACKPVLGRDAMWKLDLRLINRYRPISHETPRILEYSVGEMTMKSCSTSEVLKIKQSLHEYQNLISSDMGQVPNFSHKITLHESAHPFVTPLRTVPYARQAGVEKTIKDMVDEGIWESCETSDWQHGLVAVPKPDGTVRITADLTKLNQFVVPVRYPLPKVRDIFDMVHCANVFSKLDLTKAYFNITLSPESRPLTATITSKGLYQYRRLPMGLKDSAAVFQKCVSATLSGIEGCVAYIDDILVFGKDKNEHDLNLHKVLKALNAKNFRLNLKKSTFGQSSVPFLGHIISAGGKINPNPERVRAIVEMPPPTDVKGVQRFLGMLTYCSSFIPNLAIIAEPIRSLTRKETDFEWTSHCQKSFEDLKTLLSKKLLQIFTFDPMAPTIVSVDASSIGLGAVLTQIQNGKEVPVEFASHTLQPQERRYAANELEALACVWACENWEIYLLGRHFTLRTDHQALQALMQRYGTGKKAAKFWRWYDRLSHFDYEIEYRKGNLNIVPDALSRAPISTPPFEPVITIADLEANFSMVGITWNQIKDDTEKDKCLNQIMQHIQNKTWPKMKPIAPELQSYYICRSDFYVSNGLLMRNEGKVVLPENLRKEVLCRAHEGHPGIVRMKRKLRETYWWPRMNTEIETFVKFCQPCQKSDKSNPPLNMTPETIGLPTKPWERIAIDITGPWATAPSTQRYIITLIDHFSSFPEYKLTGDTTTTSVIKMLKTLFARYGCPDVLLSDNGPQFCSTEFINFLKYNGIKHLHTAVYNPQTNGQLERWHRTLKGGIQTWGKRETWSEYVEKLVGSFRHMPSGDGQPCPIERFFGWRPRMNFEPAGNLKPDVPPKENKPKVQTENGKNLLLNRGKYLVGDKVIIRLPPPLVAKGESPFSGPFNVEEVLGNWTYRLSDNKVHNARKMRKWFE